MQEASVFMLIADMYRGVPAVYNTFFSYDEVAHHSGIDRPDAFKVLRTLDEAFARLERAAAHAPRPYHFVVLSDHGQSLGATFRQRHGRALDEVVRSLIAGDYQVTDATESVEDWHQVNLALSEALKLDHAVARLARRVARGHLHGDRVELGPDGPHHETTAAVAAAASDAIVLASGNLGLISFPRWPERMTYEQIAAAFPKLLPGLVATDWVGFVMVRSEREGGLVIGPRGTYALDRDAVTGDNPLADYGSHAAAHLRRTDGFTNAPDILVMSRYDPASHEVAAFEELVGSHGGLGGPQTQPFVLHPAPLDPGPAPIVGAAALHAVLRRWAAAPQPLPTTVPTAAAARSSTVGAV